MRPVCLGVLVGVCCIGVSTARAASFGYRKSISIDKSKVGVSGSGVNTLSNYPMLYSVTDGSLSTTSIISGRVTSASGYDIIFRATDTTTCGGATLCTLSHQIERYVPLTGNLVAWVKLPSVNTINAASSTIIYVYYGNSSVTTSSERATNVWDSNFKGVWHLADGTTLTATDSTSNARNLTITNATATSGEVDGAASFNGTTAKLTESALSISAGSSITVSYWSNVATADVQNSSAFTIGSTDNPNRIQAHSPWSDSTLYWDYGDSGSGGRVTTSYSAYLDAWAHVELVFNSGSNLHAIYINGALANSTTNSNKTTSTQTGASLGNWNTLWLKGGLDEFRVSSSVRSADWIKTDYNNQSSPATFHWGGSEGSSPPTAIRLYELGARRRAGGIEIGWSTGHEVDNLGFHVYRDVRGRRSPVTPSLVAGSALFAGTGTTLATGRSYVWRDEAPPPAGVPVRYWLEEVALDGKRTWHGPTSPVLETAPEPSLTRSALLDELGRKELGFRRQERRARDPGLIGTGRRLNADEAGSGVIRLKVREEGWYRVDRATLLAAGLRTDARLLRVEADGEEQAVLATDDGIELYGLGADTPWTDERAYFVSAARGEGMRIAKVEAASGGTTPAASFPFTLERRDRSVYFAALKNGDADNFFGPVVTQKVVELPVAVEALAAEVAAPASLDVELQGVSEGAHQVDVALNGRVVGQSRFEGQGRGVLQTALPAGLLVEGENKLTLLALSDGDVSLLDLVRLQYPRQYHAVENVLRFPVPKAGSVTVRGFTRSDVRAMDVSNPDAPVELVGMVAPDGDSFALTLTPEVGASEVLAFTGDQVKAPMAIEARSLLLLDPAADLVVVSPRSFFAALRPLVERRQNEGHVVQLVDVEDIFDAHGFGQKTPYALRRFFEGASRGRLKYAMLVGDASFDPRNHLGMGRFDLVPTKLVDTRLLETASDDWLADFDGDGAPEVAVGRLPVRTEGEVVALVEKIVGYQAASPSVLIVSGRDDEGGFGNDGARLFSQLPGGTTGRHLVVDALGIEETRKQMFAAMKEGPGIVEYLGHGSVEVWADGLFGRTDVDMGTAGNRASVFVAMTCLNGFFHDVYSESLAETLLKAPQGGAVAVWASSGLTQPDQQWPLGEPFVRAALHESATLGEAARRAKAEARSEDVRRTWVLFGDPSMRITEPPSAGPTGDSAAGSAADAAGCQCRMGRQSRSPSVLVLFAALAPFVRRRRGKP